MGTNERHEKRPHPAKPKHMLFGPRRHLAASPLAGAALLGAGVVVRAGARSMTRPAMEMAPATPVAIAAIPAPSLVKVKGKVVEIFGNKFIVQGDTGRALIETGPKGDDGKLVSKDELVSVQGRYEDGFLRATYLIRADGKTEQLGPGGPPHGPHWLKHLMK